MKFGKVDGVRTKLTSVKVGRVYKVRIKDGREFVGRLWAEKDSRLYFSVTKEGDTSDVMVRLPEIVSFEEIKQSFFHCKL